MTVGELQELITSYAASTQLLAALGLALDARLNGAPFDDEVASRTDAVLNALRVADVVAEAAPSDLTPMLATIRSELLMGGRLLSDGSAAGRWRETERRLHQAFGDLSAGFGKLLHSRIAPELPGLSERLSAPDAAFLDIGTGVGALALGMAGEWPGLNVVGIEPLPGVLAQARDNVAAAGCTDRIALRVGRGEDIADTSSFDLVFVPSAFIPEPEVDLVVERGAVALRPGGWLLLATVDPALEALPAALVRFRIATWGGTNFSDGAAEALLARCGLTDIRRVRGRPGMPFGFIAGRRTSDRRKASRHTASHHVI